MTNTLLYLVPVLATLAVVAIALFRPRRDTSRPMLIARDGELQYLLHQGEAYLGSAGLAKALRKAGHGDAADIVLQITRQAAAERTGQQP